METKIDINKAPDAHRRRTPDEMLNWWELFGVNAQLPINKGKVIVTYYEGKEPVAVEVTKAVYREAGSIEPRMYNVNHWGDEINYAKGKYITVVQLGDDAMDHQQMQYLEEAHTALSRATGCGVYNSPENNQIDHLNGELLTLIRRIQRFDDEV